MKVLIACEESGTVRNAFESKGHSAWSCDLLPSRDNSPYHFQMGILELLAMNSEWDLLIAHPPCTDTAVSGARHFAEKIADGRQARAIQFFMALVSTRVSKWAVEQPISILSTVYRKPDQIIQPWQFGHGETKATCLWLHGLPLLRPTNIVAGRSDRIHKMPPGPNRARERSKTYQGIADAMAEQWGAL